MMLNCNHRDVIKILNDNKDKIQEFELVDDTFFLVRFTDGNRVEIEAEDDCGVLATYIEIDKNYL